MNDRVEGDRTDVPSYRSADQVRADALPMIAMADLAVREAGAPGGRMMLEQMRALDLMRVGLERLLAEVDVLLAECVEER